MRGEAMQNTATEVSWFKVIGQLSRWGVDQRQLARDVQVTERTIYHWQEGITEPRYSQGAKVLEIYRCVAESV